MQELGGSTVSQLAQARQWKYSIPHMSCSVYKWGLAGGQEPTSMSLNFFVSSTKCASSVFCDRLGIGCAIDHWVVRNTAFYIGCLVYSLLLLLLLIFPLLSY